jgi:hypothetical protein
MDTRRDATWDLVAAVYPLLDVAAVTGAGLATGGVHQGLAPQTTAPPYLVIQAPAGYLALPAMSTPGQEVRFQLKALSADPTFAEALLIIQAAIQVLDGVKPVIANHLVLRLWWEWTRVYEDPELVNGVPIFNAVSQWCALVDQVS